MDVCHRGDLARSVREIKSDADVWSDTEIPTKIAMPVSLSIRQLSLTISFTAVATSASRISNDNMLN